jgi:hypothetical protein
MSLAMHVDEKSLTKESIDITDFYTQENGSQAPNITFNTTNSTYTSDTSGVVVKYFGTSGTWHFDDNTYPSKILLTTSVGTTLVFPLGTNLQSANPTLLFKDSLFCGTASSMTYNLTFKKF